MDDLETELFVGGGLAVAIALYAWLADRRRMRRSDPDNVGFMPWTGVFFWAVLAALVTLGLAIRAWLTG